jgi:Kef-type K+ transport system membrane component KefB
MDHDVVSVLLDILVVLVAAKIAAEVAERIGIPAVVGEIVAGVLVGPSVLDLVGGGDVLRTLGELGVVLLLLEVGMEMDLGELGKVGRTSLFVGSVGVVAPLLLGLAAASALGFDFNTSLFVAAALTATSVGITARVFGELRALATTEARVVLGAAVADDVMGLVVLTVVVRVVTEGTVSALDVTEIVVVALGFLVFGGLLALWVAPKLFDAIERHARSAGTIVALALAFTLVFAELADAAQLAVVVGAFLAGLALGRTQQAPRIRRELAPVGHLFVPVFFLQIGIDVDVSQFGDATVLRDAALLLGVAVVGKLVSAVGTAGTPCDKLLVGLGMLPRGEVGLIFATIGLSSGVLGDDLYAALLIVVLATTLITPVLLRRRFERVQRRAASQEPATATRWNPPPGGWIGIVDGEAVLTTRPNPHHAAEVAFVAARWVARARPSAALLDWFAAVRSESLPWTDRTTKAFTDLLAAGTHRSWRFLDALDVLPRAAPELAEALRGRRDDAFELEPTRLHRWDTLARLAELRATEAGAAAWGALTFPDRLLVAAFLLDVLGDRRDAATTTQRFVERLGTGNAAAHEIATLALEPDLMTDLARHDHGRDEPAVLSLAVRLRGPETAQASYILALVRSEGNVVQEARLAELHDLVQRTFRDPLFGPEVEALVTRRRAEAAQQVVGDAARWIERAPREYLVQQAPEVIARHAELLAAWERAGRRHVEVAVHGEATPEGDWVVDIVAADRPALLGRAAGALSDRDHTVRRALAVTWPAGPALESFQMTGSPPADPGVLSATLTAAVDAPLVTEAVQGAQISFDDAASPWYTVCEITAPDAPRLLAAIAAAFAAAGVDVHAAVVATDDGIATDRFELSRHGARLHAEARTEIREHLERGVELPGRRRALGRWLDRRMEGVSSLTRQ